MLPPKDQLTICFAHDASAARAIPDARDRRQASRCATAPPSAADQRGRRAGDLGSGATTSCRARSAALISRSVPAQISSRVRHQAAWRAAASAQGVNARAVAEHAMSLILAMTRQLHLARDNQVKHHWRGMISNISKREDELGGKTLLIVGLGQIGGRLAQLAKAFDMRVIGIRRDPRAGAGHADAVHAMSDLKALLPQADFVALTCPLTAETEKLIDADALGRMNVSSQRGARACGRRAGARRRARATADQGRRARRHGRGAAARGLAAVGHGARAHHATHRRRDLPLRGRCARDHAGESRAALARRDRAAEPGGLDDRHCERPVSFIPKAAGKKKRATSASSALPTQRAPSCLVRSRPALRYARFERG